MSPLGLSHPAPHGSLHQTLCYPANVYNAEVLEPYVYPLINRAQERVSNHPVYVKGVEPVYTKARTTGEKVWNGPVRPVVTRVQREIRRAYLTFVQPHIPYFKTKFHTITAPYTSRVAALHNQYLHPQIAAAQSYANSAKDQTVKSYKYAASHPITGHAGRYANLGYQVGRKRSIQAYNYSKPHVIKGAKEAERIAREILGPRVIKGLEVAGHQVAKGYGFTKRCVSSLLFSILPRISADQPSDEWSVYTTPISTPTSDPTFVNSPNRPPHTSRGSTKTSTGHTSDQHSKQSCPNSYSPRNHRGHSGR